MPEDSKFLKIFFTLFVAVFVTTMGASIIGPLLPVYAHELGANAIQIGLIFGAFSLSRSIFVPFFGKFSDIKGKKPLLLTGLLLYFLLSLMYSITNGVWHLIFLRLAQGFASAMILPVAQAYVGIITPRSREGRIMGLFNVSLYGGLSVGPIMGGIVKDHSSIRYSFLSMGLLALSGFMLCLFLLPPRNREPRLKKKNNNKEVASYLSLMRDFTMFSLFFFRVCFTICIGIIWTFLPLVTTMSMGLSSTAIGGLLSIHVLVSGIFQTPMGYLADRFNKKAMIIVGGIIGMASILALSKASNFWQIAAINALLGFAASISIPAVMALSVIEGRKAGSMGSVMGLMAQAHSVGMLFGPVMAGLLMEFMSFRSTFIIAAIILGIGTVMIYFLPSLDNKKSVFIF